MTGMDELLKEITRLGGIIHELETELARYKIIHHEACGIATGQCDCALPQSWLGIAYHHVAAERDALKFDRDNLREVAALGIEQVNALKARVAELDEEFRLYRNTEGTIGPPKGGGRESGTKGEAVRNPEPKSAANPAARKEE